VVGALVDENGQKSAPPSGRQLFALVSYRYWAVSLHT
jgi:hypothetical protein